MWLLLLWGHWDSNTADSFCIASSFCPRRLRFLRDTSGISPLPCHVYCGFSFWPGSSLLKKNLRQYINGILLSVIISEIKSWNHNFREFGESLEWFQTQVHWWPLPQSMSFLTNSSKTRSRPLLNAWEMLMPFPSNCIPPGPSWEEWRRWFKQLTIFCQYFVPATWLRDTVPTWQMLPGMSRHLC